MIEEIWKNHSPKWPKNISRGFSHYVLSNGLNWVNINSLKYIDCGFVINFIGVYLVKAHSVSSTTPPLPQNSRSWKNCSEIGGSLKGGEFSWRGGVSKLFHQFFFRKACFRYYWNTFFFFCLVNILFCCNQ